jgi:hypothetical protein
MDSRGPKSSSTTKTFALSAISLPSTLFRKEPHSLCPILYSKMLASVISTGKLIALPYLIGQKRDFLYTLVKKEEVLTTKTH